MRVNNFMECINSALSVKVIDVSVRKNSGSEMTKLMLLAMATVMAFEPSLASAGAAGGATAPWDDAVTAIFQTLTGTLGKTIATLAVIVLGIMAMAGKLAWDTAIKVVLGIVMMFSAATIVNWIAPTMGGVAGG